MHRPGTNTLGDTASTRKSQGQETQRALQRLARHASAAASELKKIKKPLILSHLRAAGRREQLP